MTFVRLATLAGVVLSLTLPGHASAQGLVMQRSLSLAMARTIAEAALAECKS